MHMYKTTESPLLGTNEGAGSLDRFLACGCGTTTYIIPISLVFASGLCDVYMGSLAKLVFWSTTACIRALQHPQDHTFSPLLPSISLTRPHTVYPLYLYFSPPPLSSSSLYLALPRFIPRF